MTQCWAELNWPSTSYGALNWLLVNVCQFLRNWDMLNVWLIELLCHSCTVVSAARMAYWAFMPFMYVRLSMLSALNKLGWMCAFVPVCWAFFFFFFFSFPWLILEHTRAGGWPHRVLTLTCNWYLYEYNVCVSYWLLYPIRFTPAYVHTVYFIRHIYIYAVGFILRVAKVFR